jgi:deoxyadenosine/deoxycytidine kinase
MNQQQDKMLRIPSVNSRIEVCGGIASGKTTFAILMKRIGFNTLLEDFQINPFLEDFYSDAVEYTFETEISFILQHYHQIKKEQVGSKVNVCDFSFLLDLAYAEIGLRDSKLKAFHIIHDEIKRDLPPPALFVHLNCDSKTELQRVRTRGRAIEESVSLEFLEKLNKAVAWQVENARRKLKVITIDSAKKNFVDDESVKQELMKLVSGSLEETLGRKFSRKRE